MEVALLPCVKIRPELIQFSCPGILLLALFRHGCALSIQLFSQSFQVGFERGELLLSGVPLLLVPSVGLRRGIASALQLGGGPLPSRDGLLRSVQSFAKLGQFVPLILEAPVGTLLFPRGFVAASGQLGLTRFDRTLAFGKHAGTLFELLIALLNQLAGGGEFGLHLVKLVSVLFQALGSLPDLFCLAGQSCLALLEIRR